jgi:hypothetical protein
MEEDRAENGVLCNEKRNCIFTSPGIVKHDYMVENEIGATVCVEEVRNSYHVVDGDKNVTRVRETGCKGLD